MLFKRLDDTITMSAPRDAMNVARDAAEEIPGLLAKHLPVDTTVLVLDVGSSVSMTLGRQVYGSHLHVHLIFDAVGDDGARPGLHLRGTESYATTAEGAVNVTLNALSRGGLGRVLGTEIGTEG